ncbi:MAG: hypothetical protein QOF44_6034, partial [Streptomyces sp.]|nr:hypothetical protein [Streptomyces sp.]
RSPSARVGVAYWRSRVSDCREFSALILLLDLPPGSRRPVPRRAWLKNRPPGEVRIAPFPPLLVVLWRDSAQAFGTAQDGRLFFTERGNIVGYTICHRVWKEARALALPPALAATPLGKRPCDLRHCGVRRHHGRHRLARLEAVVRGRHRLPGSGPGGGALRPGAVRHQPRRLSPTLLTGDHPTSREQRTAADAFLAFHRVAARIHVASWSHWPGR